MATGPIETHLHRSFNWENAAPGPREGPRGRSANCGNGLFAQCVRLRSEINRACNTMVQANGQGLLNFAGELEVLHALQLVDRRGVWAVFRFQVVAQPVGTNIAGDIDGGHI